MALLTFLQVEDIVDTGNTLSCLIEHLKSKGASSISVCTLLDKPSKRKVNFELVGEGKFYRGFEVISNILFALSCLAGEKKGNASFIIVAFCFPDCLTENKRSKTRRGDCSNHLPNLKS